MERWVIFTVMGTEATGFADQLPPALKAWRFEQSASFHLHADARDDLRELNRRVREHGGLKAVYWGQAHWVETDLVASRIFQLTPEVLDAAYMGREEFRDERVCSDCGKMLVRLRLGHRPKFQLDVEPPAPLFAPSAGTGAIIERALAESLADRGLLRGAKLVELEEVGRVTGFVLLSSVIDLGWPVGPPLDGPCCAACGNPSALSGYYPLYAHPTVDADVYYSLGVGQQSPIVSGALAAELFRAAGEHAVMAPLGWHPEHDEEARAPSAE
jgi:hypothetical protein